VSRRTLRGLVALPGLGVFGALLAWGASGLDPFGHFHGFYGQLLNAIALPQRHTTNTVTAIVFDYRGIDTMGEELILFAAVVGVVLLLRDTGKPTQRDVAADDVKSDALHVFGVLGAGVAILVGAWLAAFGLVTPGGGFQGGVAIASGVAVLFLTAGYRSWRRIGNEDVLDPLEGTGAAAYVSMGIATLIAGSPFLHNFLGPGTTGTLVSGGSLSFLNWAVALEVAAANVVLYTEFLEQYVVSLVTDTGEE
jgi:multicomponent Na+:H+ antiporter subunit B